MRVNGRNAGEATAREYVAPLGEALRLYASEFADCQEFDVRIVG